MNENCEKKKINYNIKKEQCQQTSTSFLVRQISKAKKENSTWKPNKWKNTEEAKVEHRNTEIDEHRHQNKQTIVYSASSNSSNNIK